MATFTITTPVNIDSLASKAGGDIYNINGGVLTIDQDSRYGLNQSTSASLGAMTLSATLGGTVEIDARFVRLIPYNTGTGNVPVSNTVISKGGASGLLIGVYSALNVAPTAAGAAMPASGYIKVKQWNSVAYSAGALTGISANATAADRAGWIELVGDETALITVNRLNFFRMRGEWFEVGTTDGNNATSYQLPTNGSNMYLGGVYVETAVSSGVYEFYPCAGSMTALAANISTSAVKGKVCWISTGGLLRFQNDGTNSTGGYLPVSGLNIRIPNIITQNCTAAARTVNALPNATLATRYEFSTAGGGALSFDKVNLNWYASFSQAYSLDMSNVTVATTISVAELVSPIAWTNVNVGQEASVSTFAFIMSLSFAGGSFTDCSFTRYSLANSAFYVINLSDMDGFTFNNINTRSLSTVRGNASTGAMAATRVNNSQFNDCTLACGRTVLVTCVNVEFNNTGYYDSIGTTTTVTIPQYMFDLASSCSGIMIDGVHFNGLYMSQPYAGILSIGSAGCTNINLRNLGTPGSPLDMGSPRVDFAAWSRVTTTATVTSVGHGLKVGDIVYVPVSSVTAAIAVGAKVVAAVPTADTFSFVCLNAGATSGTLSYYGTMCAGLVAIAANAAANDVRIQRCYTPHLRTNIITSDNTSKNIIVENVYGDWINNPVFPMLNGTPRGLGAAHGMTAQTACYGTHWFDSYMADIAPNGSAQAWARTTTTATVTSAGHGLRTGLAINVTVSSSTAAIILGIKTVTVIDADTFTFTCFNTGSASGTLDFVPLISRIGIFANEATSDTTENYIIDSGVTAFTSAGGLFMPNINDQITFETPYYIIGHTGFPIVEAAMTTGTITNYGITYALDKNDGLGYGSFHNLSYPRVGGSGTAGNFTITVTDATGIEVGDYVFGTNVGGNAKVLSIASNTVTVDNANVGTVSGIIRFNHLPNETGIDAEDGIKVKVRIKTLTVNTTAITSLLFYTESTNTSRAYQYPLDVTAATLSLTGLQSNSEIRVFLTADDTLLAGIENSGTSFTYDYTWLGADLDVYIVIHALGYNPIRLEGQLLGSEGLTIPIQQQIDRVYSNL